MSNSTQTAVSNSRRRTIRDTIFQKCRAFSAYVALQGKVFGAWIFDGTVRLGADFVYAVLSQQKVQDAIVDVIVKAINAFMDQEDFGAKMDKTARSVMYDKDRRMEAARDVGREVFPLVTGFVGGVASSLTSGKKKGKKKKSESISAIDTDSVQMNSSATSGSECKKDT